MKRTTSELPGRHRSPEVMRLVEDMERKIRSGELAPGDSLPGVHALTESYHIAYGTAIRACKTLREMGLVVTLPGRGTFVRGGASSLSALSVIWPSPSVLSESENPHTSWVFQRLLAGINAGCLAHEIPNQLLFLDAVGDNWRKALDAIPADVGVLFAMRAPPAWTMRLAKRKVPFAIVQPDRLDDHTLELPHAYADYFGGVREGVMTALHGSLRRRPAFIGGMDAGQHESPRREGYLAALGELGLKESAVILCDQITREAGAKAVDDFLGEGKIAFDFLFAANDLRALGAMDALLRRGVHVPRDVAVLGFDDYPGSASAELSTVKLPIRELGEQAVGWFLSAVAGGGLLDAMPLKAACPFVERTSTRQL